MSNKWKIELLWLAITAVIIMIVLFPIWNSGQPYPFYLYNIVFIFIFVTFTRFIFWLQHSFLFMNKWPKAILFFLCIPIFFLLMEGVFLFQIYLDDHGINSLFSDLSFKHMKFLGRYTQIQLIFFGVGSLITTLILPIRLIISTWRDININNESRKRI